MKLEHTIKSKIMGRTLTFSRPGSSYIFVDTNGREGTLGEQPTDAGSTLTYHGDDQEGFAKTCTLWYRRHIAAMREYYCGQ